MAGINRVHIDSKWGDTNPRIIFSRKHEDAANLLYRDIFNKLNMPLEIGNNIILCNKEELAGRYDWQEGIDCILKFHDGTKATMQEKYLSYHESTVTITEDQKNKKGAYYTCTAQYYFVGYSRIPNIFEFQDWILLDLPRLHILSSQGSIDWKIRHNKKKGYIGITFRYLYFNDVPSDCVIARMEQDTTQDELPLWEIINV